MIGVGWVVILTAKCSPATPTIVLKLYYVLMPFVENKISYIFLLLHHNESHCGPIVLVAIDKQSIPGLNRPSKRLR